MTIYQFDKEQNQLNKFDSTAEAASVTGIDERTIKRALSGELKTGGGFVWSRNDTSTNVSIPAELYKKLVRDYNNDKVTARKAKTTLEPFRGGNPNNVLVIGDLHAPFTRDGYLEHCRKTQEQFNCGTVVLIGDVIDNHFSSFHTTDADGLSAKDELNLAIEDIQNWYKLFPVAKVCIGNHDAIITRKAFEAGISNRWIKQYSEVLGTPGWDFDMEHEVHGVIYYHGTGSSGDKAALNRAMNLRMSVVQGHIHTVAGVSFNASKKDLIFGMQVGCGIDDTSYALAYAQSNIKKSIISCGVVLNSGTLPIVVPMSL